MSGLNNAFGSSSPGGVGAHLGTASNTAGATATTTPLQQHLSGGRGQS